MTRCSVEWSRAQKECGGETHTGNYKRREHTNGNIQSKVRFTLFPELLLWAFNSFIIAFYISISLPRVWNTCVLILRCKVFRLLVTVGLWDLMILNWGVGGGHCPLHCTVGSSIPGLYLLETSGNTFPPSGGNWKYFQTLLNVPCDLGKNQPLFHIFTASCIDL